jgi:hypothetical protein
LRILEISFSAARFHHSSWEKGSPARRLAIDGKTGKPVTDVTRLQFSDAKMRDRFSIWLRYGHSTAISPDMIEAPGSGS